ncbi:MAG: 4Fe-4S dicluster domain-containing protein [Desulfovibrionaceae bacterium]
MRLQMIIDATKCMNCKACVVACQQRNGVPYGKNRNWVRETRTKSDVPSPLTPLSGIHYQPGNCMQCEDAPCVRACPTGATFQDAEGVVLVRSDKCIGCGACRDACPYDARFRHPQTLIMDKCDFCASSRAAGLEPACVTVCPTHARLFGDADAPDSPVAHALREQKITHIMGKEHGTRPSVAYIGGTSPTDWPHAATLPAPLRFMPPIATAIHWTGGIVLGGILAVALRQLLPQKKTGQSDDT